MSKKKDKVTYVGLLFDNTGSMYSIRSQAVSAVNEYIEGLQGSDEDIRFTQVYFNSRKPFEIVNDNEKIKHAKKPTLDSYRPNDTTPLYDSMGHMIVHMDTVSCNSKKVVIVVMTDGEENASKEFSAERVRHLVSKHTDKGWGFVFLGANIDSFAVGSAIGISVNSTANFRTDNMKAATRTVADATLSYASGKTRGTDMLSHVKSGDSTGIYRDDKLGVWRDSSGRFAKEPQ